MTEAHDRELEDEARALLHPARVPLAAPAEVKARALRRLMLALPIAGGEGDGGESSGETGAPPGAAPAAASGLGKALAMRVPAWSLLVSFVAGGAIAGALARAAPTGGARPQAVIQSVVSSAPAVTTAAAPSAPEPPASVAIPASGAVPGASVVRLAPPSAPARATGDGGLEAERALLDVARTAVGRGDGANALRATDEHARKFPRGVLAEEREAMSIQALRLLHRDDEAQARLDRFRGRFPTSLIRPALEAADGGSP